MTETTGAVDNASVLRVRNPGDLIEAIPYLLGFHPRDSLVIVGLAGTRVSITARVDLDALGENGSLAGTLQVLVNGGSSRAIVAIFDNRAAHPRAPELPHRDLIDDLAARMDEFGIDLVDAVLVACGQWWSYCCADDTCCPPTGRDLPGDTSPSRAAATYAGLVALTDREELAALLAPDDDAQRAALDPVIAEHENLAAAAAVEGHAQRRHRSIKRALFAAARDADESLFPGNGGGLSDDEACRFAVALSETPIRDAVWLAIDQRRLDGRALWRQLARRVPPPYDAAPLFLFGWASWRDGNGVAAGIAAERAMRSDPECTAAELLLGALRHGLDPHRTPRLRMPKSA